MAESRESQIIGVDILFLTTAAIACSLRCFVRVKVVKAFGLDDWLMTGAMAFFIAYITSSVICVQHGAGRHHADLDPADIEIARKHWWLCYPLYAFTMSFSKLSIGYFLLRITSVPLHKYIIYTACTFTLVTSVVMIFVTAFECWPVDFYWSQYNGGGPGKCIDIKIVIILAYLYSATNVFVDFAFAVLPVVMVMRTQLRPKVKLLLAPLLAMGCVASLAVAVRMGYLWKLGDPDFMWATADIAIWSTVEAGLAITAGSLATLKPLLAFVGSRLNWTKSSRSDADGRGATPNHSGNRLQRNDPLDKTSGRCRKQRTRSGGLFSVRGRSDLEASDGDEEFILTSTSDSATKSYSVPYAHNRPTFDQTSSVVSKPGPPSVEIELPMQMASESQEHLKGEGRSSGGSTEQRRQQGVMITKTWVLTEDRVEERRRSQRLDT